MKLISMVDYVLDFEHRLNCEENNKKIIAYAKFLSMPLDLWMFVPCDGDGKALNKPIDFELFIKAIEIDDLNYFAQGWEKCKEYKEALENVIFKDAVIIDNTPYKSTKRFMVNLKHPASFRIYNKINFHNGYEEIKFLPNFSKNVAIEYMVGYGLELTQSAINKYQI